jgi:hypothetical protein
MRAGCILRREPEHYYLRGSQKCPITSITSCNPTLGVYDNRCEKLAPRLLADVQRMVLMLNEDDLSAGALREQARA